MTVLTSAGAQPAFDAADLMAAIDRAKVDITDAVNARIAADVDRLQQNDDSERASIAQLRRSRAT